MNWKFVSGAVQGRGHAKKNIPCQDKVTQLAANGVHVIALADGAGSAELSHYGAARVVNSVAAFVAENFTDLVTQEDGRRVTREIMTVALNSLEEEAAHQNCALKDLASTLLLAAVSDEKYFLIHLGDGVIGYLGDAGLRVASAPDNGEFSNETVFVTSASAAARMRVFKGDVRTISGFVLMSDGTEQSLYNKRSKILASGVQRLLHRTCLIDVQILKPQLEEALSTVIATNTQDDCSIALLARTSAQLPPLNELPAEERHELFKITGGSLYRNVRRKLIRCDKICALLETPMTLRQLAGKLHVKPPHLKKKMQPLLKSGVVTKTAHGYEVCGR